MSGSSGAARSRVRRVTGSRSRSRAPAHPPSTTTSPTSWTTRTTTPRGSGRRSRAASSWSDVKRSHMKKITLSNNIEPKTFYLSTWHVLHTYSQSSDWHSCIFIKCKNVKCVKIDIICNVQYIYLTLKVVVRCLINIITKLTSFLSFDVVIYFV